MRHYPDWLITDYTAYIIGDSDREHEIRIRIKFSVGTEGIGGYEFWGERCFDEGRPCVQDWEVLEAFIVSQSGKSSRRISPDSTAAEIAAERFAEDEDAWLDNANNSWEEIG